MAAKDSVTLAAPEQDDGNQASRQTVSPTEFAAVNELCNILARILMRVGADKPADANNSEGGEQ